MEKAVVCHGSTQHFSFTTSANLLGVGHNSRAGNERRCNDEKGVLFGFHGGVY